jgi:RNA polymerase II subunit A-like phosphatase
MKQIASSGECQSPFSFPLFTHLSLSSTPRTKRKRLRSLTPSEANSGVSSIGDPSLRSPLAKRKKLSADRFGAGSKLRESHTIPAPDFTTSTRSSRVGSLAPSENGTDVDSKPGTPRKDVRADSGEDDSEDDGDEGSEEAFDIDDDFLAREMEEEVG